MKTTSIGKAAENQVAKKLNKNGYKVIAQNWKTRICEIDLIAKKEEIIYFIEVKYRSSDKQGDGVDYITPRKLKQMHFAAEIWNQQNKWDGDYRLLGAGVSDRGLIDLVEIY